MAGRGNLASALSSQVAASCGFRSASALRASVTKTSASFRSISDGSPAAAQAPSASAAARQKILCMRVMASFRPGLPV